MSSIAHNRFLDLAGARIRRARPRATAGEDFSARLETVGDAPFVSLWFRTRGCRHDARGGCTMCNYGASTDVSEDQMVEAVRRGLATLDRDDRMMLLLSASGSMFDEWEVPAGARERIFRLALLTRTREIVCESRVDTLAEAAVHDYATLFDDREAGLGIGLESADPWILKYSVNKALSLDEYRAAVAMLRRHEVRSFANVLLGAPFLSEGEAIADAVAAIRWAFAVGTSQCVLFPAHVKEHTLVHWLWRHDLYTPPSLWSLVRVLHLVGPQLTPAVTISWYKDYFAAARVAGANEDSTFACSPTTCRSCRDRVMALLDTYRDTGDFAVVEELGRFDCDCRRDWEDSLGVLPALPLVERAAQAYEALGRDVMGEDWWRQHGGAVIEDLVESAGPSQGTRSGV